MHIGVIAADIYPNHLGGAETHLVEVLQRLAKKSHRFEVFVGPDTKISRIFPQHVNLHAIRYPKVPNLYGLSYTIFAPVQIERSLKRLKIDAIWAKQVFPQAVVGAVIARKLRKPLFVTAQNPLAYKEELVIKGPIPFKSTLPSLLTPLVKFSLRNATVVAAVSTYSELQARKLGAKRTVIIPNGVDFQKFQLPAARKKRKKKIIVTTSSLIPRNGVDTLLQAVAHLPKQLRWKLVIAGDGPEYNNLKSQISNLKLEKKVKMLGRVENREIPKLLSSADVFIRLSRKEGFGVSFLEAMAAGVPVIATPVGGITDFVVHGRTGLLVAPNQPVEASRAIERLLKDRRLYARLQHNGEKLVKEGYSWEKVADEVHKVFTSIT